ncbi:MAG: transcription antitermination factor NusB [Selenomonadaceae bacterium]|nr:transcription antitermination factor NusB [Selenomonadaceae bacterium]
MSRTLARETAFRALFQLDFNPGEIDAREIYEGIAIGTAIDAAEEFNENDNLNKENLLYVKETVKNVRARLEEIDEIIKSHLKKNWTLSRLAAADRNILRLAVYELTFAEDKIPVGVAINEAVKLAKKYGTDDSGRFVNGVLDAVAN